MKKFLRSEGFVWVMFCLLIASVFTYLAVGTYTGVTGDRLSWRIIAGFLALVFYVILGFTFTEVINENKEK
jgi:hypothetical protein